ncbi:phosphoribosyl-AMP cyclohydrolase [Candidatus Margulisiibacteriota bacterium]
MTNNIEETNELKLDFKKLKSISELKEDVVPVVIQDIHTKDVLILGYTNKIALDHTLKTGKVTLWSTSRNELWIKGSISGDYLEVVEIRVNCEQNSLLYEVKILGQGVCHTKNRDKKSRQSCYYRKIKSDLKLGLTE